MEGDLSLIDRHGRVMRDLRVSLTDRCNLRCRYCMPAEGPGWLARETLLTDEELMRLIGLAVQRLGIRSVRLTGGEPLLRPTVVELVRRIKALDVEVALTTNGVRLAGMAEDLAEAGLDRVNVSLDTIRPDTFRTLTRRDHLDDVLAGLEAAQQAGLRPVKVNAVLLRGINDDQAPELLEWCLARGYALRIIEQMPLEAQGDWNREDMVTADETLARLRAVHVLEEHDADRGSAPAQTYLVDGGPGTVGVIASVTRPFCGDCDRIRLTADGQLRNCLFARHEHDLRASLRNGASDDEIIQQWLSSAASKLAGHGIDDPGFLRPSRPMSAIGG